jgi:hypothetical protein
MFYSTFKNMAMSILIIPPIYPTNSITLMEYILDSLYYFLLNYNYLEVLLTY